MLSDMGTLFFKMKQDEARTDGQLGTRYRNEYTKVRQALARIQRAETPGATQLQQPHISPQEDHAWDWHEWNSEEVLEWDSHAEGGASAWFWWNWSSWKENRNCSWKENTGNVYRIS